MSRVERVHHHTACPIESCDYNPMAWHDNQRLDEANRKIDQLRGAYREAAGWITAVQLHYGLGPEASPEDIFMVAAERTP